MPREYLTYAFIGVGLLAVIVGMLWPVRPAPRRCDCTRPGDPEWEPWAYVYDGLGEDEISQEMYAIPSSYHVGEVIEGYVPTPAGMRFAPPSRKPLELGDGR